MKATSLVVTVSTGGSSRSRVWDTKKPLALGQPLPWVLERTSAGVQVRGGSKALSMIFPAGGKGATMSLRPGLSLAVRPVEVLDPAFVNRGKNGPLLQIYSLMGSALNESVPLEGAFTARAGEDEFFKIRGQSDSYIVESCTDGLAVHTGNKESVLNRGQTVLLNMEDLCKTRIHDGQRTWVVRGCDATTFEDSAKRSEREVREWAEFRKSLLGSAGGMALLLLILSALSLLKPKEEELIPEQFTKIVMTPPKRKATAPGSSVPQAGGGKATNQKNSVVQAFKGASLQAAASKLLKGGMTRLLAQSDFVMGQAASEKARQSFGVKSTALAATAPAVGLTDGRKVEVAGIGGATGPGKGVGYGKGEKAGVQGQGQAFVSMDVGGAAVDEGLTRDEVGAVIHKHMSEIRYCYESSILRYPSIEGKLVVAFVIGGQGSVKSAEVKDSTLPDPKLDDCIVRRLRSWQFPLPRGGVDVAVSYPFIFKSLGG